MAKMNPADVTANRLMELQRERASETRRTDLVLIVLCAVLILALGIGIYCVPHRDFSEVENRNLQTFPKFSVERVWNGKFMAELKAFYTDQFPARDSLVAAKAAAELAIGKGENNGVILGEAGYLIKRIEYGEGELATLGKNLDAVEAFRAQVDLPVSFALAPRAIDVLGRYLPPLFSADRAEAVWAVIDEREEIFSLRASLTRAADAGEAVWYRTDHHWTTLGAYYAYRELGTLLGYTPLPADSFTPELAADDFLGTTYSASGFNWTEGEEMYFWRYAGDTAYRVEIFVRDEVSETLDGFYDRSYLEKKDKYAAFLSSNRAHMRITRDDGSERPTLLLIKDSFAHAVVPFLAEHYDLEILDLRYYRSSVSSFLETHSVDGVLILCGIDSLATSDLLTSLPVGLTPAK